MTLKELRESLGLSLADIAAVFFRAVSASHEEVVWRKVSPQWVYTLEQLEGKTLTEKMANKLRALILRVAAENARHQRELEAIGAEIAISGLNLNATRAELERRPIKWGGK